MAAAYLTRAEAAARLGLAEADAPSDLDLRLASDAVDASGPFIGEKLAEEQAREFPRTWVRSGDIAEVVPDNVLDAVAILAQFEASPELVAAVKSESDLDSSITYETALVPEAFRRAGMLLAPYQRKNGRML